MSIALFSEILGNFPAQRCRALDATIKGGIECVYALVWPGYVPPVVDHPAANRRAFSAWRQDAGVAVWAWVNVQEDQAATADAIATLDATLDPDGWLLDIEGEWVKGANLGVVLNAAKATGKPVRVSFAGVSAAHVPYDFKGCDKRGITVEWQAYFDSGEGPSPGAAVQELYASTFVIEGWEYRHRLDTINGSKYGWGKTGWVSPGYRMNFNSYIRTGDPDATFAVRDREWGWWVHDRNLYRSNAIVGRMLGRAAGPKIRVALDVTRGAATKHTLAEWTVIAASAKCPGLSKRKVAVYLAEVCPDDVLAAIAEGAP